VSKLEYIGLIFVDPRLNVSELYYRDLLLSQQLLPATHESVSSEFISQQNNAQRTEQAVSFGQNTGISQGSVATHLRFGGV